MAKVNIELQKKIDFLQKRERDQIENVLRVKKGGSQ